MLRIVITKNVIKVTVIIIDIDNDSNVTYTLSRATQDARAAGTSFNRLLFNSLQRKNMNWEILA